MDREESETFLDLYQIIAREYPTESKLVGLISNLLQQLSAENLEEIQDECCKAHERRRLLQHLEEDDNFKQIADAAEMPVEVYRGAPLTEDRMDNYEAYSIGHSGGRKHILQTDFKVVTNDIIATNATQYTKTVSLTAEYRGLTAIVSSEMSIGARHRRLTHSFMPNKSPRNQHGGSGSRVGLPPLLRLVWEDLGLDPLEDEGDELRSLMKLFWGLLIDKREFERWDGEGHPTIPTIWEIAEDEIFLSQTWDFERLCWVLDEPQ
jgi:hypothetical protein